MHTEPLNKLMAMAREWFVHDDDVCRQGFQRQLAGLASVPARVHSWALPDAPDLRCDVAWLGDPDAESVLVMISGTHGVEGFCGSAVQRFLLDALSRDSRWLPPGCALLMIHGLNPWGMRHARRCDQDGIDLNRNFLDFNHLPPADSLYLDCLEKLCHASREQRFTLLQHFIREHGQSQFDYLFSGGQYHCPWGPFYGGEGPSWSSRVVDDIIDLYKLADKTLLVIDVHTGLGPWSFGELICDHPARSQGEQFARGLFGPAVSSVELGESFSVPKHGLLDYRWHALMAEKGCYLTLEFGTYGTKALFEVLINDHALWMPSVEAKAHELEQQRSAMLEHFCPDQRLWQQAVLFKSWQVTRIGLEGMQNV